MHTCTDAAIEHVTNSLHLTCRLMDAGIPLPRAREIGLSLSDWMRDELAAALMSELAMKHKNYAACKTCGDNPLYGGAGADCARCKQ